MHTRSVVVNVMVLGAITKTAYTYALDNTYSNVVHAAAKLSEIKKTWQNTSTNNIPIEVL